MVIATALLVYVLWTALAAGLVSFTAASIGATLSPLALNVFALWGPLALTVIIFLCLWFDHPKKQSNRLAWIIVPYCVLAIAELGVATLYLYVSTTSRTSPVPTLVMALFLLIASYYAFGALSCVTRDAYRTVEMNVQLPRSAVLMGTRRV